MLAQIECCSPNQLVTVGLYYNAKATLVDCALRKVYLMLDYIMLLEWLFQILSQGKRKWALNWSMVSLVSLFPYLCINKHHQKMDPYLDPGTEKNRPPKNRPVGKTGFKRMKTLSFVSRKCWKKMSKWIISIQKVAVCKALLSSKNTFENCTTNFYFEHGKVGIKTENANLSPILAWNVFACLRIFMKPGVQQKHVFIKLPTFLISRTRRIFTKMLGVARCSWKFNRNKFWKLLVILLTSVVNCNQRLFHGNEIVQYLQNC